MAIYKDNGQSFSVELIDKWFIFYAAGLRLFWAGFKLTTNPYLVHNKKNNVYNRTN
jgi:hypothetical protein